MQTELMELTELKVILEPQVQILLYRALLELMELTELTELMELKEIKEIQVYKVELDLWVQKVILVTMVLMVLLVLRATRVIPAPLALRAPLARTASMAPRYGRVFLIHRRVHPTFSSPLELGVGGGGGWRRYYIPMRMRSIGSWWVALMVGSCWFRAHRFRVN